MGGVYINFLKVQSKSEVYSLGMCFMERERCKDIKEEGSNVGDINRKSSSMRAVAGNVDVVNVKLLWNNAEKVEVFCNGGSSYNH